MHVREIEMSVIGMLANSIITLIQKTKNSPFYLNNQVPASIQLFQAARCIYAAG
jgi:hypothetical protein